MFAMQKHNQITSMPYALLLSMTHALLPLTMTFTKTDTGIPNKSVIMVLIMLIIIIKSTHHPRNKKPHECGA